MKLLFQEGVQFNANKLQAGGGSGLGLWITKGGCIRFHLI
jgi:signal transduction histidine kinase